MEEDRDPELEGKFVWTLNGELFGYTNFFPGEPNIFGGNENHLAIGNDILMWKV